MRSNHEKAIVYFRRALKLNPQYLSAWTLMGHEFVEMKNTNAAIEAYRRAVGRTCYVGVDDRVRIASIRYRFSRLSGVVWPGADL